MTDLLSALNELKVSTDKVSVLEKHKEDENLSYVLRCTLDPFIFYFIDTIPDHTHIPESFSMADIDFEAMGSLDDMIVGGLRQINSDSDPDQTISIFAIMGAIIDTIGGKEDRKLLEKIVAKDLGCGVTGDMVNQVWPNLVREFDVMYPVGNVEDIKYPSLHTMGYGGVRALAFSIKGKVELRTSYNEVLKIPSIESAIVEFAERATELYDGFTLDGVIAYVGEDGTIYPDTTQDILHRLKHGIVSQKEKDSLRFFIFDILSSLEQLGRGVDARPLEKRIDRMKYIVDSSVLLEMPSMVAEKESDRKMIKAMFKAQGVDTMIIRPLNSIYECGDTTVAIVDKIQ